MDKWSSNRLTVLGSRGQVQRFLKSNWDRRLRARHGEWMENSPCRLVCVFETDDPPLEPVRSLSRRWLGLTFLLDFEVETDRLKGLAKAKKGQLEHCQFSY
jgi:hypothetical protein